MKCRICGTPVWQLSKGVYLQRVNPKGEAGVFECYVSPKRQSDLVAAIEATGKPLHEGKPQK